MNTNNYWADKNVVILGGAALVGSHLVDLLKPLCRHLWVADDLSSGKPENIPDTSLYVGDLSDINFAKKVLYKADVVIHLACAHGGRTYVDTHYLEMYQNLALDATIFKACLDENVQKVFFMSSACAYPVNPQNLKSRINHKISENELNYSDLKSPDGAYGFSKLAAELQLQEYGKHGLDFAIGRGFTIYGPRMKENHAIAALIAKSVIRQEPFQIYGDGKQKRNWTFVKDTVRGIALATEYLHNDVVNIGTEEVNTPLSACEVIWNHLGWRPDSIEFIDTMVGPQNRIADATKAREKIHWTPGETFVSGVEKTIDWYLKTHSQKDIEKELQQRMFNR